MTLSFQARSIDCSNLCAGCSSATTLTCASSPGFSQKRIGHGFGREENIGLSECLKNEHRAQAGGGANDELPWAAACSSRASVATLLAKADF